MRSDVAGGYLMGTLCSVTRSQLSVTKSRGPEIRVPLRDLSALCGGSTYVIGYSFFLAFNHSHTGLI